MARKREDKKQGNGTEQWGTMQFFRIANELTAINPFGLQNIYPSVVVWCSLSTIIRRVSKHRYTHIKHTNFQSLATPPQLNWTSMKICFITQIKFLYIFMKISSALFSKTHRAYTFEAEHGSRTYIGHFQLVKLKNATHCQS